MLAPAAAEYQDIHLVTFQIRSMSLYVPCPGIVRQSRTMKSRSWASDA